MPLPQLISSRWKMTDDCAVGSYILRSEHSRYASLVRFINDSDRIVDIIWINFEGLQVKYRTLKPGTFLDVNTYVTHPWMFLDAETRDRLVVKSKEVFFPEPYNVPDQHLRREPYPIMMERAPVHIMIPLYTLRERSLQIVRNNLSHPDDAFQLELPKSLQIELAGMIKLRAKARFATMSSTL